MCSDYIFRMISVVSYSILQYLILFFFFKQKTAYEMRISDWSSDVCSSDLQQVVGVEERHDAAAEGGPLTLGPGELLRRLLQALLGVPDDVGLDQVPVSVPPRPVGDHEDHGTKDLERLADVAHLRARLLDDHARRLPPEGPRPPADRKNRGQ